MDSPGYSSLFELLPIGAYRSSPSGKQLRANAALVRLNGYTSEAEMLASVNDIAREWYVDPDQRAEFKRLIERDGQVLDFVSEIFRHKTRERIWIRENAHVVRDEGGQVRCFEGTVEDITGQRRTQLALEASERRFRALTEKAQVLIVVCDAASRIGYASPASQPLLGLAPEALVGTRLLDHIHPEDVAAASTEFTNVVNATNTGLESILRARHADGSWRWLASLANNCLAEPAVAGIVLNLRDVTERQQSAHALRRLNAELEQRVQARTAELERARDEAEAASRAKSDFLSRMSHELRTPLNAILGFGQLLQATPGPTLSAQQQGQVRQILRAGAHLLELINEVLDLARIEAGGVALSLVPVAVAALLQECAALVAPAAQEAGVGLLGLDVLAPAPGGGECFVVADRTRLKQVLLNLLSNAIKYNRRGGTVRLGCSVQGEQAQGEQVRISVADTGPGLGPRERERLFRPFERLGAEHRSVEGAGIGLALSKRLVELMQGKIGLDSEVGRGSSFWVDLARALPPRTGGDTTPTALPAAPPTTASARVHTVLYIEDNPVNVLLMQGLMSQEPRVRLLTAALPDTGLALARSERPDLILLDIQLPGIDGYEVLRRLRSDDRTRHIPVMAVSANAMPIDLQRGRDAGFADYLTKPLDLRSLLAAVRRVLPG